MPVAACSISSSSLPVTTNEGPTISKPSIVLPAFALPFERRDRDLAEVLLGGEAVADEAVGDFAGDLGHQRADAGEEHLRWAEAVEFVGVGREERCHQRVAIELAAEIELLAVSQVFQIARIASTNSRIRAAGFDHSIENRFSMWGLIWLPRPRTKRPFE